MITGIEPCSARAIRLASLSSSPSGPHSRRELGRERGRALDLVAQRRRGAAQRGGLERGDERVADGGARLEAAGQRHDGHAVLAGPLGEQAAGGGDDPRRAGGAGRVVGRDGLLRRARVARAQHERLLADPRRDVVAHGQRERAPQPGAERAGGEPAADGRAAHARDDRARRGRRRARGWPSPRATARRAGARRGRATRRTGRWSRWPSRRQRRGASRRGALRRGW